MSSMYHTAVLDFIGLPVGAPGNLECRLQKGVFKDDGTWIDDGSRPVHPSAANPQAEKHRRVVEYKPVRVRKQLHDVNRHLESMGYDRPDISMIEWISEWEWKASVIQARRARLKVSRPELRLVVRALGFDIVGDRQLAISFGKATFRKNEVLITQKNSILLRNGDSLETVIQAIDMVASIIDYQPISEEDKGLLRHVGKKLWPERVPWISPTQKVAFTQQVLQLEHFDIVPMNQVQSTKEWAKGRNFN